MAHLNTTYESFETYLNDFADLYYTVDLAALNSSGVTGTAILGVDLDERTVNISISAENLTPLVGHAQHIHGLFDGAGNPIESNTPTLADDADLDGFVEVLEGVPSYGDILLPLDNAAGLFPLTQADGSLQFIQSYSLDDDSQFVSPVTGTQYEGNDILPAQLRELVLHGVVVPDGEGAGTGNEVDGGTNGFLALLPAAAGEFEKVDLAEALDVLEDQQADAGETEVGTIADERLGGTIGDDMMSGRGGDDLMYGRGGDDMMEGLTGADKLFGNGGDDMMTGGRGDDVLFGGVGDDSVFGNEGNDRLYGRAGNDLLVGGDGDDRIMGGAGLDIIGGLAGKDTVVGGEDADEFHFDAGTGTDRIVDFQSGEDVISFLDGGAIDFANSAEDSERGDSDLSILDYAERAGITSLQASDDQKVVTVQSSLHRGELMNDTSGDSVELYLVAFNETRGEAVVVYDDDWSTTAGRETIAHIASLEDLTAVQSLGVTDFDVY